MSKSLIVAVDYDQTIVSGNKPIPGALETLRKLIKSGHKIVLYTRRNGALLDDAVQYLQLNKVAVIGANKNPHQVDWAWSNPAKLDADIYIDNLNLGTPLITDTAIYSQPVVDWLEVTQLLIKMGALNKK